jgi:acetyl esterase/lipase
MSVRSRFAVALAVLVLGVVCWTVVPPPVIFTLALALVAGELALPALAVTVALGALAWFLARGRARTAVLAIVAVACACLTWPVIDAPFARAAADRALADAGIPPAAPVALAPVDLTRHVPVMLRGGGTLALNFYRPRVDGDVPLIVMIYGGAWRMGEPANTARLDRWYAARGFAVAAIDYRHAPEHRFPAQRDDVEDALRTIAARAGAWHVDASRVALFGRSSGGELALIAAERPQPLRLRAVVAYYAPSDLVRGWNEPPQPDPIGTRRTLEDYLGGPPDSAHVAAYRAASPLDGARLGMPPVLLVSGARDDVVEITHQRALAARLQTLGVPVVAIELPWANHAFDEIEGLGAPIAREAALRFLEARLSRSAGR